MNTLKRVASAIPGYQHLQHLKRRFTHRYCRGIYRTFQEARDAIPSGRIVGFDHPESPKGHLDLLDQVQPSDYAMLYWLGPLLAEYRAVFDLGGNVGLAYYAFQKYLNYPPDLRWLVCEVPAVAVAGQELALERKVNHLQFTSELSKIDGFPVLITSGTLQFIEVELSTLLSGFEMKPRHLLINRVPLSHRPTYYTISDKKNCSPYRIANRAEFIDSLQRLGYYLIDSWGCYESTCRILFHPGRKVSPYSGMYLRLDSPQA